MDNGMQNADYKKAIQIQKRKNRRNTVLIASVTLLLGVAVCLLFLWSKGYFYIVDRQTSPDGKVTTTAYSRNVSGTFPVTDGFTVKDTGYYVGTANYMHATFDGMWWSPDSRYLTVSMVTENGIQLSMADYENNSEKNLDVFLDSCIYRDEHFSDISYDEDGWPAIEYRFLQWSEYDSIMLIYYRFLDTEGADRSGYFWYACDTGAVSGVMELPGGVARGIVKEGGNRKDGTAIYVMDLKEPDENGNVVEFVFSVVSSTQIRETEQIQVGDEVMVVYRPAAQLYNYPAISVTVIHDNANRVN